MPEYSSAEAAAELDVHPRVLRRFIRQNDSWKNATHAGRYSFSEADMRALKVQFPKWQSGRLPRRAVAVGVEEIKELDLDPGIRPEDMGRMKTDYRFRNAVLERRRQRHQKLQARINQVGLNSVREMEDA